MTIAISKVNSAVRVSVFFTCWGENRRRYEYIASFYSQQLGYRRYALIEHISELYAANDEVHKIMDTLSYLLLTSATNCGAGKIVGYFYGCFIVLFFLGDRLFSRSIDLRAVPFLCGTFMGSRRRAQRCWAARSILGPSEGIYWKWSL